MVECRYKGTALPETVYHYLMQPFTQPLHLVRNQTAMKTRLTLLTISLATTSLLAQSWKQNRPVANVSSLRASAGVDVFLRQGATESLTLDVKGFDEDEVIAEVRDGQLTLSRRQRSGLNGFSFGRSQYIKAYVTVRQLANIDVSSGADLEGETDLRADNLTIKVSSGADMTLRVNAQVLTITVSSGADANLSGSVGKLTAAASGGADLKADQLRADICYAEASGGADARVYGAKELYLRASGGGDVTYRGPGRVMARRESGGGDINED